MQTPALEPKGARSSIEAWTRRFPDRRVALHQSGEQLAAYITFEWCGKWCSVIVGKKRDIVAPTIQFRTLVDMAINDQRSTSEKLALADPMMRGLELTMRQLATNLLKRKKLRFGPNVVEGSIAAIKRLANETLLWCSHMEYSHSGAQVSFSDLYIDVEMYLQPLSLAPENLNKRAKLKTILKSLDSHLILLGRPGSGKTTAMKALCQSLLTGKSTLRDYYPIPILLRLREIDNTLSLFDTILSLLGIVICDARDEIVKLKDIDYGTKQDIVLALLNESKFVVIFDGFDEIENVKLTFQSRSSDCRTVFVQEFKWLCLNVTASLTCPLPPYQ